MFQYLTLKTFRTFGHTPGHPEYDLKRGIETTSGPLGQGLECCWYGTGSQTYSSTL